MSEMARKLPLVNKLMYTADLVGTQAMAQSRGLWLLFFLAPPKDENLPAAVPALGLVLFELDPRVFVGVLLTAGRLIEGLDDSSGPHHQDSGEAKIRESTAGVSRKPSSDGKACGCSSKHLCGLTAWNT